VIATLKIVFRFLIENLRVFIVYMALGVVSAVVLPFLIPFLIYQKLFGVEVDPTPEHVAKQLRGILADPEDQEVWEDLESETIKEPRLAAIRKEALSLAPVPVDAAGLKTLEGLLERAESLGKES
jgi:hypothetical protein